MADQPKRKSPSNITRNSDRKNGKRAKSTPDSYHGRRGFRGSHTRGVHLSEVEKVLLGGGALVRIRKPAPGNEPASKSR